MTHWSSSTPPPHVPFKAMGPEALAFASRVKAVHHWIRKGNDRRAALVARELFHQVNAMIRRNGGAWN